MRIPENKIEEIRSTADIVDVISEYVQLRKRGKNYVGLCPFHTEKTPSFTISEEKQIFHCFGCHAGGNVFKFLMDYKKISFVEAVQEMAEQFGIQLEYDSPETTEQQSEQEILYDINTEAARYYSNNLLNDDEGEGARNYLQNRSIKTQMWRTFGLGYALSGWENFVSYLKSKGIDLDKAAALGLIGKSSDGRYYDKLSGRLIFPIFSPNGRVVAFAGRILNPEDKSAKYINSPESLIYVKGRTLYGLSLAKDEIRRLDKAIVVEGYMDLISLYQAGVKNVVAVSGTALTDEQVQLLSRYTKNAILLFDADTAGIKAAMRSIELLLKKNIEVKIAALPEGEDPDSFVNKYGKDKFEDLMKKAENFLEYQSGYFEKQGRFDDPASTAESIRELVSLLALIDDELKRNLLLKNIAKKFNLREMLLESELINAIRKVRKQPQREQVSRTTKEEASGSISEIIEKSDPVLYNLEKEIIKLLFDAELRIVEFITKYINPDEFEIEYHNVLAGLVINEFLEQESVNVSLLIDKIKDDKLEAYLREITFDKYAISSNWEERNPSETPGIILQKYARDTVLKFKLYKIDEQIKENHKRIESADNDEEVVKLMNENKKLEDEKRILKESFEEIEIG